MVDEKIDSEKGAPELDAPAPVLMGGLRHSEQFDKLALALSKAQSEMELATKNAKNPFFGSRYADLGEVMKACRPALSSNEIAVVQAPSTDGADVTVTTRLIHSSGQWIECVIKSTAMEKLSKEDRRDGAKPTPTNDPQALGSVITYLRRYALSAMAGVATEDDDGEGAYDRDRKGEPEPKAAEARAKGKKEPAKLAKKDIDAIVAEFGKLGVPLAKLEEKLERKSDAWIEADRLVLLKAHKSIIKDGVAVEEVFGLEIEDPKAKEEPGSNG